MWIVSAIVVALIGLYSYLAFTCFFTKGTFLAAYRTALPHAGEKKKAIESALAVFRGRPPFSSLTDDEVKRLADVLALVEDDLAIAEIVRDADRKKDISHLRDSDFLARYKAAVLEIKKEKA